MESKEYSNRSQTIKNRSQNINEQKIKEQIKIETQTEPISLLHKAALGLQHSYVSMDFHTLLFCFSVSTKERSLLSLQEIPLICLMFVF